MNNFWDPGIWGPINVIAALLLALIIASLLKKSVKVLKNSLIPTSVLAGAILLIVSGIYLAFSHRSLFETPFMGNDGFSTLETITYHSLALGFIASTFESSDEKFSKKRKTEVFNTGLTTVGSYLLQAVLGLGITILASKLIADFFPASGMILPFGYGQGTGQAMNYGNIYETQYGFVGGKSFGLAVSAFGFISASIGGVIYLSWLKKKNHLPIQNSETLNTTTEKSSKQEEIPLFESMDTLSVQLAFVMGSYLITYVVIYVLGELFPGMKSVIYGFNFLIGVLVATIVKKLLNTLEDKKILKKHYVNEFLMIRLRNLFYDVMVVAGISAIQISTMKDYVLVLCIMCVIGAIVTFIYNRIVAKTLFKDYADQQFVAMYGMLTGTASTGIVMLREIDENFETPVSDNLVYQNFPAIVFGIPLMLIAATTPEAPERTLLIAFICFIALNILLFRSQIAGLFKKKK